VHIFENIVLFVRPGPRRLRGPFSFSLLEICVFPRRGALGSRKRTKNGNQERFFDAFFGGRFRIVFLSVFERLGAAQDRSRAAQDRPRGAQERPKSGPRAAQERPRAAQEQPKSGQERPKSRQERPRAAQERLKAAQERPNVAKERPKIYFSFMLALFSLFFSFFRRYFLDRCCVVLRLQPPLSVHS
jgi:hypothetical protein